VLQAEKNTSRPQCDLPLLPSTQGLPAIWIKKKCLLTYSINLSKFVSNKLDLNLDKKPKADTFCPINDQMAQLNALNLYAFLGRGEICPPAIWQGI